MDTTHLTTLFVEALNRNVRALDTEIKVAGTKARRNLPLKCQVAERIGRRAQLLELALALGISIPESPGPDPLAGLSVGELPASFSASYAQRPAEATGKQPYTVLGLHNQDCRYATTVIAADADEAQEKARQECPVDLTIAGVILGAHPCVDTQLYGHE